MELIYNIIVVGAGGTGSALLSKLARFSSVSKQKINGLVVDGDRVEHKNLERQNFFENSVGKYKAEQIVDLAADSYGLNWSFLNEYLLEEEQLNKAFASLNKKDSYSKFVNVLFGCVDNHRARQVMEAWFENQKDAFYIDSANDEFDGEIVIGTRFNDLVYSPSRAFYYEDVLTDNSPSVVEESCAVRNISSPQHQVTNDLAGNICLTILVDILKGNVPTGQILFNALKYSINHWKWDYAKQEIVL